MQVYHGSNMAVPEPIGFEDGKGIEGAVSLRVF
jgi:hypothetical protein